MMCCFQMQTVLRCEELLLINFKERWPSKEVPHFICLCLAMLGKDVVWVLSEVTPWLLLIKKFRLVLIIQNLLRITVDYAVCWATYAPKQTNEQADIPILKILLAWKVTYFKWKWSRWGQKYWSFLRFWSISGYAKYYVFFTNQIIILIIAYL